VSHAPAVRGPSTAARVTVIADGRALRRQERLATEEPLEIRVAGPGQAPLSVSVTMRTPGADFALAAGFLHTEGLLRSHEQVASNRYCDDVDREEQRFNIVTVHVRHAFDATPLQRNQYMTSSCGICGKASIDQVEVACAPLQDGLRVSSATIAALPDTLREAQRTFARTGGLHATGLFSSTGELRSACEDVGRHNAMDKAIGEQLLAGRGGLGELVAMVSGRASFELVQKAAVAGIPVLCAVGAPSSLAVDAAERLGLTLVGWVREGRLTVYTHHERVLVTP
jgi:FdhD protein